MDIQTLEQFVETWTEILGEEAFERFAQAAIVEFRPRVWGKWIVAAYMGKPMAEVNPLDEYSSFEYFARFFNRVPASPIKEQS